MRKRKLHTAGGNKEDGDLNDRRMCRLNLLDLMFPETAEEIKVTPWKCNLPLQFACQQNCAVIIARRQNRAALFEDRSPYARDVIV